MTPEQTEQPKLFERIRDEFFVNPAPAEPSKYLGNLQAHLAVVIGNMFEWYVRGSSYTRLQAALENQLEAMRQATTGLGGQSNEGPKRDDQSPLVLIPTPERGLLTNGLQFSPQPEIKDLKTALPVVDTDPLGTMRFNHHFLGELHPQGNLIALAASIVAAFLNENVVIPKVSPSVTTWEKEITTWMWQMLKGAQPGEGGVSGKAQVNQEGKPKDDLPTKGGRIVAGGTIANLTALFIAREKFHEWCIKSGQSASALSPVVLYSSHSHYSIKKAARIVGLVYDRDPTRSNIVRVDGKNYWYVTADDIAEAIQAANARGQFVIMVSALAGAPDTGFVDDLNGIADVISEYNKSPNRVGPPIYYHVDAAMGGPFRLVSTLKWEDQEANFVSASSGSEREKEDSTAKKLFDGIERGDAVTIDGHKYFYCNYPCGGIFVREERDFKFLQEDARYLESGESEEEEPEQLQQLYLKLGLNESPLHDLELEGRDRRGLRRTLEGSRGIIGIMQLYCTLSVFGPEGIKELLQHTLDMTHLLRQNFKETRKETARPSVELITSGPLNQTLFRVVTNWKERTKPANIDMDNQINFLLPYYASWTQTGRLDTVMKERADELRGSGKPELAEDAEQVRKRLSLLPFYIGSDQLLDHMPADEHERTKRIGAFLDYVWRINEAAESHCPVAHKQNIKKLQASVKDPENPQLHERVLQVLKVVITHPFTDKSVIDQFVEDLRDAASVIHQILIQGGGPLGESLKKIDDELAKEAKEDELAKERARDERAS